MKAVVHDDRVVFGDADRIAGEYVLNDRFKPHFRTLNTPAGHNVVIVSPGDHRHHKGLMYALRCTDLNFWEEDPGPECGVQETISLQPATNGIRQELLWHGLEGGRETYRESREIRVVEDPALSAFRWQWSTRRVALRDHTLIQSQWSMRLPDGRLINYHGLGIRLPWMWCFPGEWTGGVRIDGQPVEAIAAAGTTGPEVAFVGMIDGQWDQTYAKVTLRQQHGFTWYVLRGDFPYLAVGPSNAGPIEVTAGQRFEEHYEVIVSDEAGPNA